VTNTGQSAAGAAYVTLFASDDATLGDGDVSIASSKPLRLKPGKSKTVKLRFTYPSASDPVYLLARAGNSADTSPATASGDAVAASSSTVTVAPANVQLIPTSITPSGATLTVGKRGSATLLVTNNGNVPYKGTLSITLDASQDQTGGNGDDIPLGTISKRVSIKPGATKRIRLNATLPPSFPAGTYYLAALVNGSPVTGVTVQGGGIVATAPVTVTSS
jgi:hypothetical protein